MKKFKFLFIIYFILSFSMAMDDAILDWENNENDYYLSDNWNDDELDAFAAAAHDFSSEEYEWDDIVSDRNTEEPQEKKADKKEVPVVIDIMALHSDVIMVLNHAMGLTSLQVEGYSPFDYIMAQANLWVNYAQTCHVADQFFKITFSSKLRDLVESSKDDDITWAHYNYKLSHKENRNFYRSVYWDHLFEPKWPIQEIYLEDVCESVVGNYWVQNYFKYLGIGRKNDGKEIITLSNNSFKHICIKNADMSDAGRHYLMNQVKFFERLTSLHLVNIKMDTSHLLKLIEDFKTENKFLVTLDFSSNFINWNGARCLLNFMKVHPCLKKINLSSNAIEKIETDVIIDTFLSQEGRTLDFRDNSPFYDNDLAFSFCSTLNNILIQLEIKGNFIPSLSDVLNEISQKEIKDRLKNAFDENVKKSKKVMLWPPDAPREDHSPFQGEKKGPYAFLSEKTDSWFLCAKSKAMEKDKELGEFKQEAQGSLPVASTPIEENNTVVKEAEELSDEWEDVSL